MHIFKGEKPSPENLQIPSKPNYSELGTRMNFKGRRFPLVMLGVGLSKMLLDLILPDSL